MVWGAICAKNMIMFGARYESPMKNSMFRAYPSVRFKEAYLKIFLRTQKNIFTR